MAALGYGGPWLWRASPQNVALMYCLTPLLCEQLLLPIMTMTLPYVLVYMVSCHVAFSSQWCIGIVKVKVKVKVVNLYSA